MWGLKHSSLTSACIEGICCCAQASQALRVAKEAAVVCQTKLSADNQGYLGRDFRGRKAFRMELWEL